MKPVCPVETTDSDGVSPTHSAAAAVYTLLANASSKPLGLEDWLRETTRAFKAQMAALAAIMDGEPVVEYFFPGETARVDSVRWPWRQERQLNNGGVTAALAAPLRSADGRSSFLTVAVPHEGIRWLLCLEDACARTWSIDEEAALTLAALGLFQLSPVLPGAQKWVGWSRKVQAQQRLEDAADVVRHMAHDFNNVLTSVLGFTELSLTQLSPGSPLHSLLTEVYAAAQQGSQFISRLSFFSARKTVRDGAAALLREAAEAEVHRLRQVWGEAIALEIRVPPELPALSIDVESLRVVLGKLLENAREAIDSTGTVRLAAREIRLTRQDCLALVGNAGPGAYVEISVADSGRGFSDLARERVLAEPFFSTKPRYRGLGLASVYGILTNHGGAIWLDHSLEKGSSVHVFLPSQRSPGDASSGGEGEQVRQRESEKGRERQAGTGTAPSRVPSNSSVPAPRPSHAPTFLPSHAR